MEDFDDMMNDGSSSEQRAKMESYRREYENHIKRNIYKVIKKRPEHFVDNDCIPNRVNLIKGLITFYEESSEFEKCGFLLKLQNIIEEKEVVIEEIK